MFGAQAVEDGGGGDIALEALAGIAPFAPARISRMMRPISGTLRTSFSSTTLARKPVLPVIRTRLPDSAACTFKAGFIGFLRYGINTAMNRS
jgi:hypothetical protein